MFALPGLVLSDFFLCFEACLLVDHGRSLRAFCMTKERAFLRPCRDVFAWAASTKRKSCWTGTVRDPPLPFCLCPSILPCWRNLDRLGCYCPLFEMGGDGAPQPGTTGRRWQALTRLGFPTRCPVATILICTSAGKLVGRRGVVVRGTTRGLGGVRNVKLSRTRCVLGCRSEVGRDRGPAVGNVLLCLCTPGESYIPVVRTSRDERLRLPVTRPFKVVWPGRAYILNVEA